MHRTKLRLREDISFEEIAKRLQREKREIEKHRDAGKEEGFKWAGKAHYNSIQIGLKFADEWNENEWGSPLDFSIRDEELKKKWVKYWDETLRKILSSAGVRVTKKGIAKSDISQTDICDVPISSSELSRKCGLKSVAYFLGGWCAGVKKFWEEVESNWQRDREAE